VIDPTLATPSLQLQLAQIVRQAPGPICTRLVALRSRLDPPVASLGLNQLADFGILDYDADAEGWVACG
jgi:hypothetical protein